MKPPGHRIHTHPGTLPRTRRQVFNLGGRLVAGWLLVSAFTDDGRAAEPEAVDWRNLFARKPEGGSGVVKEVAGAAYANQRRLTVGARVASGEQLRVAKGGHLVVSVQDRTLFKLSGEAVLDFQPGTRNTGILALTIGSIQAIFPQGNRYLVQGPAAVIGVKGTVVYRQVFQEDELTAQAADMKTVPRPPDRPDYFCTCTGTVDYLLTGDLSAFHTMTARHHGAAFLDPNHPRQTLKAPQLNHFDPEIARLIDLQDPPRHDKSWMERG
jgi:hypothetical protein